MGLFRRLFNRFLRRRKKSRVNIEEDGTPSTYESSGTVNDGRLEHRDPGVCRESKRGSNGNICDHNSGVCDGNISGENKVEKSECVIEPFTSATSVKDNEKCGCSMVTRNQFPDDDGYSIPKNGTKTLGEFGLQDETEEFDEITGVEYEDGNSRIDIKLLEDCLSTLECPFTWKPDKEGAVFRDGQWIFDDNERAGSTLIEYLSAKEHEFRLVKKNFFRKLCVHLVLAYEKALLGKLASAASDIHLCQTLVNTGLSNSNELLVTDDRKEGIYYILMSSIAHINFLQKLYKSSLSAVSSLQKKSSNFNREARAVVHGLHAGVLMEYGYRGNRMALSPVRAAIELDPECWLWSLFLGKLLGRSRRKTEFNMPAGAEELVALRRAAELQPEAQCLSHLADVYKHLNAVITRQEYVPGDIGKILSENDLESLPKMAKDLYMKAATTEPNCPYNNARCAKGLLSLPIPFKDLDLAEQYMVRALHLAPNDSLVNHYAAFYYETRREFEQALVSYRKALITSGGTLAGGATGVGNFPAELGYLALQHRLEVGQQDWTGPSTQVGGAGNQGGRYSIVRGVGAIGCVSQSSPLFQLDAMLSKYRSKSHRVQTLCNKGYYLLKVERDIIGALQAFAEAIHTDPKSVTLKNFWSVFGSNVGVRLCSPINVYDLIEEEIKNASSSKSNNPDNHSYLESLLELINECRHLD